MNTRKELLILVLSLAFAVAAAGMAGGWRRSVAFLAAWLVRELVDAANA